MSRLIDAEAYEQSLIENGWGEADDEFFTGGIFELLEETPTIKTVSLDRIKSLRDDAIEYRDDEENDFVDFEVGAINGVIALIDKLIAESEDS